MGTRIGGAALAVVLALGRWPDHDATAANPGVKRPPVQGTLTDHFDSLDTTRWSKADGWKNGSPFDNAWRADHVAILDGRLDLTLDDAATLGEPYASGELRTNGCFGFSCHEASFKPVLVPGACTRLHGRGPGEQPDAECRRVAADDHGECLAGRRDRGPLGRRVPLCRPAAARRLRMGPGHRGRGLLDPRATAVAGLWSGIIDSGDTARSTDASGAAMFYSARSRSAGSVRFCVTSVTGGGLEYDAGANLETCDEIAK